MEKNKLKGRKFIGKCSDRFQMTGIGRITLISYKKKAPLEGRAF